MRLLLTLAALLCLCACAVSMKEEAAITGPAKPALKAVSYTALPGWQKDDFKGFREAYSKTCARLKKRDPNAPYAADAPRWGKNSDWLKACHSLPASDSGVKGWIETNFTPYQISEATTGDVSGLFTGYYEAALQGSRTRHGVYQTPIYKRPSDLIMVNLGDFREELKGQRIAGRIRDGNLKPYEDRSQIVAGQWPQDKAAPLLWVDSPIDAFFLEIQGSGVVQMDTGESIRVGFDGQNGHVYKAIGKTLVERGKMSKDEVSMQSLRSYLATHPDEAQEIMNTNRSYVFFRELGPATGPTGGEGLPLTPTRSLAIDHGAYPYGLPFWVDAQDPENPNARLQRLMVGQDTGGAIKGAVRGDVFWGGGMRATQIAGSMKSPGVLYVLVPKSVGASS